MSRSVFNKGKDVSFLKQPMFFGEDLAVQRYDTMKYPIFDKLTQNQLGFFWRPEEVSLQNDRADYQKLNAAQKHIFTSNLKYQILLDSVQGRGPGRQGRGQNKPCIKIYPRIFLPKSADHHFSIFFDKAFIF